jgi:ABC-type multidrug transport system ATPase subunit
MRELEANEVALIANSSDRRRTRNNTSYIPMPLNPLAARALLSMSRSSVAPASLQEEVANEINTANENIQNVTADQNNNNKETVKNDKNSNKKVKSVSIIAIPEAAIGQNAKMRPGFVVTWKNLTYTVGSAQVTAGSGNKKKKVKTIFNSLTGQIKSGEMTALMGPSGAGKSTLLECIAGIRRQGRFGEVTLSGTEKVKVAFVPQDDHFYDLLTVMEALTFASKFRNLNRGKNKTGDIVEQVIRQLNLESCQHTRISRCSGGQRKRLSIAQELIVKPQILILDEPTSGLDSMSCFQVISLLSVLSVQADPPMAVIATIHQPSSKILALFHRVYVLSTIGRCVYDGPPDNLMEWLVKFGVNVPQFTNPADFMIELASGEMGIPPLKEMALEHDRLVRENLFSQSLEAHHDPDSVFSEENDLEDMIALQGHPLITHTFLHVHRSFLFTIRDLQLGVLRISAAVFVSLFIGYLYSKESIGSAGGCPPSPHEASDPQAFANITAQIDNEKVAVINNLGLWFFSLMFMMFTALIPTVLVFPLEMQAFAKERTNGWYTVLSYYLGKTISDIPFQIVCPVIFCSIVYFMTDQPMELNRFRDVCVASIILTMVSQSHGILFGAYFMSNIQAAMFAAPTSCIPLVVFSGFLIRSDAIPYYLLPGKYISYVRYAFEMVIVSLYGQERCGQDAVANVAAMRDKLIMFLTGLFKVGLTDFEADDEVLEKDRVENITHSLVTGIIGQFSGKVVTVNGQQVTGIPAEFRLSDSDFDYGLLMLLAFYVVLRIAAFIIIHKKGVVNK